MNNPRYLLIFIAFIISQFCGGAYSSSEQFCQIVTPIKSHILSGQSYKVLRNKSFGSCTFACELDSLCHSTNYYITTRICELNKSPTDERQELVKAESVFFTLNLRGATCKKGCFDLDEARSFHTCSCQFLGAGKVSPGKEKN